MPERPVLVLDVETVPDGAAWARLGATPAADAPLKPVLQRVVAVAAAWIAPTGALRRLTALGDAQTDERNLVAEVFRILDETRPLIAGWNTRGFDMPVLVARALIHGVRAVGYYAVDFRYRYGEDRHADLMDLLAAYGAAPRMRLAEMAAALDLPAKAEGDGTQVAAWEAAGLRDRIRAYCETDVLATACIWARYAWHRGWWGEDQATTFAASVTAFLAAAPGDHWAPWRALPSDALLPLGTGAFWAPATGEGEGGQ